MASAPDSEDRDRAEASPKTGAGSHPGVARSSDLTRVLAARSLRAFADGYVAILLPVHLSRLGYDAFAVGLISTATLLGSELLTLAVGLSSHRMAMSGLGFAGIDSFWPLIVIAFVGRLNPSGGDVSVFLPLEHTILSHVVADEDRTAAFARYSAVGAVFGALGALFVGMVDWLAPVLAPSTTMTLLFGLYGAIGLLTFLLYRNLSPRIVAGADSPRHHAARRAASSIGWLRCSRSTHSAAAW